MKMKSVWLPLMLSVVVGFVLIFTVLVGGWHLAAILEFGYNSD